MHKPQKCVFPSPCRALLSVRPVLLALSLFTLISPAVAVTYTAYPGSSVIVTSIKGKMAGASSDTISYVGINIRHPIRPFLGGLVAPNTSTDYGCLDAVNIKVVDGWTGVKISANNILGGVTGSILNSVANYYEPNATEMTRIAGGIIYDAFGAATAAGDISQDIAGSTL